MSDQINRAVAQVARRKPRAVVLQQMTVNVAQEPIVVEAGGQLAFSRARDADPAMATLLLFDPKLKAFRAVLTPPGTSWELVEKRQGPTIWRPGMTS